MSEFGFKNLVLTKEQEEERSKHANDRNGFRKGSRNLAHQVWYFTRTSIQSPINAMDETADKARACARALRWLSSGPVVGDVLLERTRVRG